MAYADLQAEKEALDAQLEARDAALAEKDRRLAALVKEMRMLRLEIAKYAEERRLERARRFGASSEAGDHQAKLFDEADAHAEETPSDDAAGVDTVETGDEIHIAAYTKRRPKRAQLPDHLPRVHVHHDLDEADRACTGCGKTMAPIGETTAETLDLIPMQAFVVVDHRATYSCGSCDEGIKTTPPPAQPLPKSNASPGLLAFVATEKYADGLPLYRQSKRFERVGIHLPRNTLASYMVKAGELVTPLIEALHAHALGYDIVQMDETPVQVLKEPNKTAQSKSYMWVMKGGPPDQPLVLYRYDPSRAQSVPKDWLAGYAGYLQTDGYAGYNGVLADDDITGLGCWAHVRRKFMDAKKALPKAQQNKGNKVTLALSYIGRLYQIERKVQDAEPVDRQQLRQSIAMPVLTAFKAWLDKQSVPPKTVLGTAIGYALTQWPRLTIYVRDGRLPIDNNGIENAIRPFAIGRKNWLFSDTQHGATASANLYSLIESAQANRVHDFGYLKYVFSELPRVQCNGGDMSSLFPWNVTADIIDRQLSKPDQHVDP